METLPTDISIRKSLYAKGGELNGTKGVAPRLAPRRARFGLFIHWGIYSVPAGEWEGHKNYAETIQLHTKMPAADYEKYAAQFNPVKFDAREWVRVATNAGMKYIVIHGQAIMTDFACGTRRSRITTSSNPRPSSDDPMRDLAEACKEAGCVKLCFFYSLPDWCIIRRCRPNTTSVDFTARPIRTRDITSHDQYMRDEIKELLTHYGPVGVMWFDGGGSYAGVNRSELIEADKMVKMIHELQPGMPDQ